MLVTVGADLAYQVDVAVPTRQQMKVAGEFIGKPVQHGHLLH